MEAKLSNHGGGVSLPEDLIFDVLSRLPAKDLCRFLCVSKGWRALISDPAFLAAQRPRAGPQLIGVFDGPKKLFMCKPVPWYGSTLELRVMDMYGNVLRVVKDVEVYKLRRTRPDLACLDDDLFEAGAVDPATGRVVGIGRYLDDEPSADGRRIGVRFSSFGRAAPSGVFKAIRVLEKFCQIAALEDGGGGGAKLAWRRRPAAPFSICSCGGCKATVNGVFYFLPLGSHRQHIAPSGTNLVAFLDLETEEWKTIEYPNDQHKYALALGELRGSLTMVQTVNSRSNCNIWFLVDPEKKIWVKKYVIQVPQRWFIFNALEVLIDGTILMLVRKDYQWMLQLYDPDTGALTDLVDMPSEFRYPTEFYDTGRLWTRSSFAMCK